MHAERLHSIARSTVDAFNEANILQRIDALTNAIAQRLSNPSEQSYDQTISTEAKSLFAALGELEVKNFPPTWKKIMSELDLGILMPDEIRGAVEEAFKKRIVDSDLTESLKRLRKQVATKLQGLTKLTEGFDAVGIEKDDLSEEAVEFDVAMPRESINDTLPGFSKELERLNKQLSVLSEISKDQREPLKINSISTNDFTVAVNINVDLGEILAFILLAIAAMRANYRQKIDALQNPALEGIPTEALAPIKEWAHGYIKDEIEKIVDRLPEECPDAVDGKKLDSKRGLVIKALEFIEKKQEAGFNMEVRVGNQDESEDEEEGLDDAQIAAIEERRERMIAISQKTAQLKVIEHQDNPILNITHSTDDDET